jgi:hypothetical protein
VSYDVAVPFCVRPQPAAVAFGRLARNLKELKQLKSVWGMEYPPRVRAKWPLSRRWAADRPSHPRPCHGAHAHIAIDLVGQEQV